MLELKRIKIKNFLSIEETEFEFLPGVHMILGRNKESEYSSSNGSGKSSLIESIPFALYKESSRDDLVRRGSNGGFVEINFNNGKNEYIVQRYIKDKKEKNNIRLFINGVEKGTRGIRRIESEIGQNIGIDYSLFSTAIMISQGFPHDFCSLQPTERKNIIESMLGLVVWDSYKSKFSLAKEKFSGEALTNKEIYQKEKETMISLNSKIEGLKSMSEKYLSDIKERILSLKQELRELVKEESEIDKKMEEVTSQSFDSLTREVMDLSSESTRINSELERISKALLEENCPTCHQPFPKERFEEFREQKNKYEERLKSIDEGLKNSRELLDKLSELRNSKNEISYKKTPINSQIRSLIDSYNKANEKEDVENLTKELEEITDKVNEMYQCYAESQNKFEQSSTLLNVVQPSSPFRTSQVTRYIKILNEILREVSSEMFEDLFLELVVGNNEKGIDVKVTNSKGLKINYKALSGGERRRLSISAVLAIQRFLIEVSAINTNFLAYDEIFDGLDQTGLERCIATITSSFDSKKCIYLISHNESIKSEFPSQIIVTKSNGISTVDYSSYISSE